MKITIGICTRNRLCALSELLDSILKIDFAHFKGKYDFEVLIVENDLKPKSKLLVTKYDNDLMIPVKYVLETSLGISSARNRVVIEALASDFIFFVDDDQVLKENIFKELITCQQEYNADAVYGRNPPLFKIDTPAYVKSFFLTKEYDYGEILKVAATNCLYVKKKSLDSLGTAPFDMRFNFIGCEDLMLTNNLTNSGFVIRSNSKAIAYEMITEDRCSVRYVIKRSFRNMNAYTQYLKISNSSKLNMFLVKIPLRFLLGIVLLFPFLVFGKESKLKGLLKISESLGVFYAIIKGNYNFYKG